MPASRVFGGSDLNSSGGLSSRLWAHWLRPIEIVSAVLVLVLVSLIFANVFFRYVLASPVFWIDELNGVLFLWVGMLGAVIALHRSEHIRLTLFLDKMPERVRPLLQSTALVVSAAFLIALIAPSIHHVYSEASITMAALGIPNSFRVASIALGIVLMTIVALGQIWRLTPLRQFMMATAIVIVIGLALLLLKPLLLSWGNAANIIFLVSIIGTCLILGVPIAFCFGMASLAFLLFSTSLPVAVILGRMDEGMSSPILLSVPVFILLGLILDATGMGKAIVDFLGTVVGHVRAGMSYVLLGSLYIVSGISGSKTSDMATVAPALFPEMKRRGNKPSEMVALLGAGSIMADTVPPSIVLIVVGSVAGLSIAALFTSGLVIALVLLLALVVVARWRTSAEMLQGVKRASFSQVLKAGWIAIPVLILPFFIRYVVGGGIATATEVSAIAVIYTLFFGVILYGGITYRSFYATLLDTAILSGVLLLILGTASATAWALTQTGFATGLSQLMLSLPGGWVTFMAVSAASFMVLGCLLEGLPAIVLLGPLMFPIAQKLGIHGIHYAMVAVVSMNIGLFLPPLGMGYYLACSIGKADPADVMKPLWVYLAALIAGLVVIAVIPSISIGYL